MTQKFSKKEINQFLKNKNTFYDILYDHKKYFLPSRTSKAINQDYLFAIARGQAYTLMRDEIEEPPIIKGNFSCLEIYEELIKIKGDIFGFDVLTLPDKPFLKKLLYIIKKTHPMFNMEIEDNSDQEERELPKE